MGLEELVERVRLSKIASRVKLLKLIKHSLILL